MPVPEQRLGGSAPADGSLPKSALSGLGQRPFGLYVHVPFCAVRCGYCDFNTYTAAELGAAPGESQQQFLDAVRAELRLAADVLESPPRLDTIFFGGGTPTLLPASALTAIVAEATSIFGQSPQLEVTTEANPDTLDAAYLQTLREGGVNRLSLGMQSAVGSVLRVLDRTHRPERLPMVVIQAREAGFTRLSLDLIYGTPGESLADWERSLDAALDLQPDHVSAYALIVEQGTALHRNVQRGVIAAPDDDDLADKYLLADERFEAAGLGWYEVSNWASSPDQESAHNRLYWDSADWWGVGPGAHSHVCGVRWWNHKHPRTYAHELAQRRSPAAERELLTTADQALERVMLQTRLRDGIKVADVPSPGHIGALISRGLVVRDGEQLRLTLPGRLLADAVVRDLLGS